MEQHNKWSTIQITLPMALSKKVLPQWKGSNQSMSNLDVRFSDLERSEYQNKEIFP